MTIRSTFPRPRHASALLLAVALLFAPATLGNAEAQTLPYQAYGGGLQAGQTVAAYSGATQIASTTADASGDWVLFIPGDSATPGATVTFRVDGALADQTITFSRGGFTPPPGLTLTFSSGAPATPPATGAGAFAAPPQFGNGNTASVVFLGGNTEQLIAAATGAGAAGMWVQDADGRFHLYITGAPQFIVDAFKSAFPQGFAAAVAVTLTR